MSAAFVAFIARCTGIKSWLHVQDFEVDAAFDLGLLTNQRLRSLMLRVEKRIFKSFDRVSTISPQMLKRLKTKGIEPEKLREVRNWIDTSSIAPGDRKTRFRQQLNLCDTDQIGLYSGSMSNKQGLDLLIEAAGTLKNSHPNIHFVLCGDGPHKSKLMAMAAGCPNIHFLELQPSEAFGELLATADFHLLPQRAEAADLVLPSKLGGIFSSSRPVIAMAGLVTGLANEVKDAGLIVAPGDPLALAAAICRLGEDQALSRLLGENARQRAIERWDKRTILTYWTEEMSAMVGSISDAPLAAHL
jgi:colanic acid biosynthesis glycosyl transferase WcaI